MDELVFKFQGRLADDHRMDFYEAARFQYAAARLSVKLDQFRRTGRFPKRVTSVTRTNIDLFPYQPGSFELKIAASANDECGLKVEVPLTGLWSYVIERAFKPTETDTALDLISSDALRAEFFSLVDRNVFDANEAIAMIRNRIEAGIDDDGSATDLLSRLISEVGRREYLASHRDILSVITAEQDAALVTMATPLLSEMAVPLRRSAKLLTITTIDRFGRRDVLTADREAAEAIEAVKIDSSITTIDVDIIQYNKETGWGKFRNPNWSGLPSFSLPADRRTDLRFDLLAAMGESKVEVDAYIVRGAGGEPLRLILVDVRRIDEI